MFKWLKQKVVVAAANQCRFNIRLNVENLMYAIENGENIDNAQGELAKDMAYGVSNGLTAEDVIAESEKALSEIKINSESKKYFQDVYKVIRELKID